MLLASGVKEIHLQLYNTESVSGANFANWLIQKSSSVSMPVHYPDEGSSVIPPNAKPPLWQIPTIVI
jgi:hypothetical protein